MRGCVDGQERERERKVSCARSPVAILAQSIFAPRPQLQWVGKQWQLQLVLVLLLLKLQLVLVVLLLQFVLLLLKLQFVLLLLMLQLLMLVLPAAPPAAIPVRASATAPATA